MTEPSPVSFRPVSFSRKLSPISYEAYEGPASAVYRRRPVPRAPYCCSTYAAIEQTCPETCTFKRSPDGASGGCFADSGFTLPLVRRLNEAGRGMTGFEVALREVEEVDAAFRRGVPQDGARGGRDLRLHVSGDAASPGAAALLGEAAARWRARGGGTVWTYTHAWRVIPRAAWGPAVTVLASVESVADARAAMRTR